MENIHKNHDNELGPFNLYDVMRFVCSDEDFSANGLVGDFDGFVPYAFKNCDCDECKNIKKEHEQK